LIYAGALLALISLLYGQFFLCVFKGMSTPIQIIYSMLWATIQWVIIFAIFFALPFVTFFYILMLNPGTETPDGFQNIFKATISTFLMIFGAYQNADAFYEAILQVYVL